MRHSIVPSLSLAVCVAGQLAAQPLFATSRTARLPTVSGRLDDVAAGDIDGDGDLDLVMVNDDYLPNFVYRNDGLGVFTDVSATALPANSDYSTDQVVGDFDGDGDVDWLVANAMGPVPSRLYLNNGAGVFTDATVGRLPGNCFADRRSFAADLDQDGDLDLVLNTGGNYLRGAPIVLRNDGSATFARATLGLGNGLCHAADIDGGGDDDLVSTACIALGGALMSLRHQLDAPTAPRITSPFALDLYATPLAGPTGVQPVLSFGPAAIPLAPLGILRIDPATAAVLPGVVMAGRVVRLPLLIPNIPRLVGTAIWFQALYAPAGGPLRLSNAVRDVIAR